MSKYFPPPEQRGHHQIFPGVRINTSAGQKVMLSLVELEPNSVVEAHSHVHEQAGYMIEGKATFYVGDEEKTLQPGDFYHIPGNVVHRVVALDEPVKVLDVFSPVREEYR